MNRFCRYFGKNIRDEGSIALIKVEAVNYRIEPNAQFPIFFGKSFHCLNSGFYTGDSFFQGITDLRWRETEGSHQIGQGGGFFKDLSGHAFWYVIQDRNGDD